VANIYEVAKRAGVSTASEVMQANAVGYAFLKLHARTGEVHVLQNVMEGDMREIAH